MATRTDDPWRRFLADYGVLVVAVGVALAALAGAALVVLDGGQLHQRLLADYGLLALFLILILEGAMLLYFAPSEVLVPAGITLLAPSEHAYGVIAGIILVAAAGATVGQYGLFYLAKRGGREYLTSKPWFRVSDERLDRFDAWFDRWGKAAVPLSNALLFTRGMLTVPAGFAEMDDAEFVVLSALGSLVFQTWLALTAIGLLSVFG